MQLGMVGLGRMGANMVRRLLKAGHQCVVFDRSPQSVAELVKEGAVGAASLDELVQKLKPPRPVWLMIPAGFVDSTLGDLAGKLSKNDIVIDGGNSYYIDDIRRAGELKQKGLHYVDVGTSGGVWGLERGYCQMIGGEIAHRPEPRSDLRHARPADGLRLAHARPREGQKPARPSTAICTAAPTAPATSSRWCTTASSTA